MQNCYLFCLCLSFRIKVKKRYLLLKKKSGIFSFRVNDILTSILSALHPFLASPNDVLKRRKRYLFFGFKRCHERHKKVPFLQLEAMFSNSRKILAVGSYVLKSGHNVPLLKVLKNVK